MILNKLFNYAKNPDSSSKDDFETFSPLQKIITYLATLYHLKLIWV